MTYEEAEQKSLTVRWKSTTCHVGEECWCRMIVPEEPILYDHYSRNEEFYIIGDAAINESVATYLINLHNNSLK